MGLLDIAGKVFDKMNEMVAENEKKMDGVRKHGEQLKRYAKMKSDRQLVDSFRDANSSLEQSVYGAELQRRRNEYSDAEREELEELIRERGR